jgi:RNA polymerase sigma-70 factor (ECF subfamily)
LLRYLRAALHNDANAEDALQRAFVALWKSAGTYSGSASVRGWLFTIARNAAFRASKKEREQLVEPEPLARLGDRAGWGSDTPESLLDALERRDALERSLSALPLEDREILLLRDVEGLPGDEAAAVLGVSVAAMKSRLHRARLRLVAEIRKELSDGQ